MGEIKEITVAVSSANSAMNVLHDCGVDFEFNGSNCYIFNNEEDLEMVIDLFKNAWIEIESKIEWPVEMTEDQQCGFYEGDE